MSRLITTAPHYLNKGDMTCKQAYDYFVLHMRSEGYREKTIKTYNEHTKSFFKMLEGYVITGGKNPETGFPIKSVTNVVVEEWENLCRARGNKDTTIQTKVKSLRTFLYWCMDEEQGFIPTPYKIKLPKADERLKEPYTEEELDVLMSVPTSRDLAEWRNWAALCTFVRTGLRLSSLCELKWDDIDFENSRLLMRHAKSRKQVFVPIPRAAADVLARWKEVSPRTDAGYVFFSTRGDGKIAPNSLYQGIRKYNLARGVDKTSVHLLRHTYATIYLQKGGRAEKLQKILDHKTPEMTQRYVHFVTDDLVKGIDDFTV